MKRINVLFAARDDRAADALSRRMDERCLVFAAKRGEDALDIVARERIDVLIVDAVLPGIDGVGVVERMRAQLGMRMPVVIGGSSGGFADEAFTRLCAAYLAKVPWDAVQLGGMLEEIIRRMDAGSDWAQAEPGAERAKALLRDMGMDERLSGFDYLAWAAALTALEEERLYAVRERIYMPVASRFHTTAQSVERLIRHAVERTADSVGAQRVYTFFGNTIDPMRGKPTNAQMIGQLGERVRMGM